MSDRLAEIQRHIDTEPVTLYGLDVAELAPLCIQVDEDRTWLLARVRELEAQMEKDAMRIRQLQAQAVKDAVVREAIKTALECLSYRERYWNAEVWDALDEAIASAEKGAE